MVQMYYIQHSCSRSFSYDFGSSFLMFHRVPRDAGCVSGGGMQLEFLMTRPQNKTSSIWERQDLLSLFTNNIFM